MLSVQSTADRARHNDRMPPALLASEDCSPQPRLATKKLPRPVPAIAHASGHVGGRPHRSGLDFRFPSHGIRIAQP
jgi:hypothetical protein